MSSRIFKRFAIEMFVISTSSAIGPWIYRKHRSFFDTWELVSFILIPIFYALAGLVIYDFRARRLGRGSRLAKHYGWYFGGVIFLMTIFQAVFTILVSPGGPTNIQPYIATISISYAILVCVLDFQAWKVLEAGLCNRNGTIHHEVQFPPSRER
jgi:peptidoglycan/LPS O-acetylase OafA/YrhL